MRLCTCVVNYSRLSWQDAGAGVRVTLDRDVCAFGPIELWNDREVVGVADIKGRPTDFFFWLERDK